MLWHFKDIPISIHKVNHYTRAAHVLISGDNVIDPPSAKFKTKQGGICKSPIFFRKLFVNEGMICLYKIFLDVECRWLHRNSYKTFLVRINSEKYQNLLKEILTKIYYNKISPSQISEKKRGVSTALSYPLIISDSQNKLIPTLN